MNMEKFTRENFEQWANQLPEDRNFVYISNEDCVIATFLKEVADFPDTLRVLTHSYYLEENEENAIIIFPDWLMPIDSKLAEIADTKFGCILSKEDILDALK